MVPRYAIDLELGEPIQDPHPSGAYCLYTDVEAMQAELAEAKRTLEAAKVQCLAAQRQIERLQVALREIVSDVDLAESYSGTPAGSWERIARDAYRRAVEAIKPHPTQQSNPVPVQDTATT